MPSCPADVVKHYLTEESVSVYRAGEAHAIRYSRDGYTVIITIPDRVLEWYIDVSENEQVIGHDWWDYEGYDKTPSSELSQRMAEDISNFAESLLANELRINRLGKEPIFEWLEDDNWKQVVFPESTISMLGCLVGLLSLGGVCVGGILYIVGEVSSTDWAAQTGIRLVFVGIAGIAVGVIYTLSSFILESIKNDG